MRKQIKLSSGPYIFLMSIIFAGILGWGLNLITIFKSDFSVITGSLVVRIIGVFIAPIGAIMGWF